MEPKDLVCEIELPGWRLHFAWMKIRQGRELGPVFDVATKGAVARINKRFPGRDLGADEAITTYRDALVRCGIDLSRAAPCSEELFSQILASSTFPRGPMPWEFAALLMVHSSAPWTVLDPESLSAPLRYRTGPEGLPELADSNGTRRSPWTLNPCREIKDGTNPLFVCFMPETIARTINPKAHLGQLVWLTWAYEFVLEKTFSHSKT